MEIQQLKGFLSVATHGCFSVAAKKTFRSQPAVSLQVKALEDELGVKLFDRISPRKLELTHEGKILMDMLSPLMDGIESLPERFGEACGNVQKGEVRVATHASVMTYLLPEVIKTFRKKYPECKLSIVNRSRDDIVSMIKDGESDIGITSLTNTPKNLDYHVFAKFKRILIAAKGHPLSKKSSISLEDIASYPLIVSPKGSNTRTMIDSVFSEKGIEYSVAMEVTGREAVKAYVQMGMGISIFNEYYLAKVDSKTLFVREVDGIFGCAERGLLTKRGRHLSSAVKAFMDMVLKRYEV